jgi:hypothetical protein
MPRRKTVGGAAPVTSRPAKTMRPEVGGSAQRMLGIAPGTLNHTRWQMMAKTAKDSQHPTADLIQVCVSGALSLKYTIAAMKPDTAPPQIRRAAYAWSLVISHGALVSDAFDSSVR